MDELTVKVGDWDKLFERHPRYVDILYTGMPNQQTFSLVVREYRMRGYRRESSDLYFPKDCVEIRLLGTTLQILHIDPEEIYLKLGK